MHIGKAIRLLRIQRNMTQEQLALDANIATSNVSRIENGQRQPSQKLLVKLADSLKTTPMLLYAVCENMMNNQSIAENVAHYSLPPEAVNPLPHLLSPETQSLLKIFNELSADSKILLLEQAKLLRRWQK